MKAFYNEIDPYCCAWLSNLMDAGLITPGTICDKSIEDIVPHELRGYERVHMFAGLGGWDYALNLAGWGFRKVWTGSAPCQPFSAAGKGAGFADERHLWPSWQHLIAQCEPPVVFGEQVASATQWLGLVCGDMEAMGRAVGFNHIEAASAGADHRRDRIFFVADTCKPRLAQRERGVLREVGGESEGQDVANDDCAVGDAHSITGGQRSSLNGRCDQGSCSQSWAGSDGASGGSALANAGSGRFGQSREGQVQQSRRTEIVGSSNYGWVVGHDGKARRVEPSIRLLADGIPARVGKLRALGNAIDPRPAAAFVTAYMQARGLISGQQAVAA